MASCFGIRILAKDLLLPIATPVAAPAKADPMLPTSALPTGFGMKAPANTEEADVPANAGPETAVKFSGFSASDLSSAMEAAS